MPSDVVGEAQCGKRKTRASRGVMGLGKALAQTVLEVAAYQNDIPYRESTEQAIRQSRTILTPAEEKGQFGVYLPSMLLGSNLLRLRGMACRPASGPAGPSLSFPAVVPCFAFWSSCMVDG